MKIGVYFSYTPMSVLAEFGGGLAILFGLLIPLVSLALIIDMAVANLTVHLSMGDPFIGEFELPLVFLGISVLFLTPGLGRYSLDHALFGCHLRSVSHVRGTHEQGQASVAPAR